MSCSYNEVNYTNKTLTLYFIQHFSNNVKQRIESAKLAIISVTLVLNFYFFRLYYTSL